MPLLLSSALSGIGLAVLALVPPTHGSHGWLLVLLFIPTLGIAFGDVLVDALMIEKGQPRGLTGRFQSIQWAAANAALLIAASLGGYFSAPGSQSQAFLSCAILWVASFVLTLKYVRDPAPSAPSDWREHVRDLRRALGAPALLPASAILFLWSFNPLWQSVLYLHATEALGMSEQTFGNAISIFFGGCMLASVLYGAYCRRVPLTRLVHVSIVAGVLSNALYLAADTQATFFAVSALAGFTYMTGVLIQLDLAARLIPLAVAATLFATIMALTNVSSSLSEMLGGRLYDVVHGDLGELAAYQIVVLASALFAASCWAIMPWLARELGQRAAAGSS
jgi:MFS family permease